MVTAPLLVEGLKRLKQGTVIPEHFYKMAYFPEAGFMRAYLLPHQSAKGQSYKKFAISVDEIEALTGMDFFSDLPDELEEALESSKN